MLMLHQLLGGDRPISGMSLPQAAYGGVRAASKTSEFWENSEV